VCVLSKRKQSKNEMKREKMSRKAKKPREAYT